MRADRITITGKHWNAFEILTGKSTGKRSVGFPMKKLIESIYNDK